jgi:UDP-glucose 4-epimerase
MSIFTNNILVTGGAGYIGSHVVEMLVKSKSKVFIFDNLSTGYKKLINKKAKFIKGDIKSLRYLSKVINENKIHSIIHLAAYLNVNEGEKNKKRYFKNNVGGTLNLVKACQYNDVKNIIFSSSCSVYGNREDTVSENSKLKPKSYYAFTKLKSEEIIKKYSKKFNYKYGILRYFNVAGASKSGKIGEIEKSHGHLIKNIAIQSQKAKPQINVYGNDYNTKDGTCVRDYIHIMDLAEIHLKILKNISISKKSLILNCGYGKGYSVQEIIEVFKKLKKNVKVKYKKRRPGDVAQVFANISKIKKVLKWKPKYNNINKIIKSAIDWEKKITR